MQTHISQKIQGVICRRLVFPLIEDLLAFPVGSACIEQSEKCQSLKGYRRPDKVSCQPVPPFSIVGDYPAFVVDMKSGMPPGEDHLNPLFGD